MDTQSNISGVFGPEVENDGTGFRKMQGLHR